jgi:hypothetical protein
MKRIGPDGRSTAQFEKAWAKSRDGMKVAFARRQEESAPILNPSNGSVNKELGDGAVVR